MRPDGGSSQQVQQELQRKYHGTQLLLNGKYKGIVHLEVLLPEHLAFLSYDIILFHQNQCPKMKTRSKLTMARSCCLFTSGIVFHFTETLKVLKLQLVKAVDKSHLCIKRIQISAEKYLLVLSHCKRETICLNLIS